MSILRKALGAGAALALAMAGAVAPATAETDYPTRPVTIIVPFGAGGGMDTITRVLAQKLTDHLGQSFVVENKGGASGNIGFAAGSRSRPDGYTLTMLSQNLAANAPFFDMPVDPETAFQMISLVTRTFTVLVAHPSTPYSTVEEFIEYAKNNADTLTSGNGGLAGNGYYAMELINKMAGLNVTQAAYQGEGPMLVDVVAGQIPVGFSTSAAVTGMVKSGQIKAIGISNPVRNDQFPDTQAFAEVLPGYALNGWWGLAAPVGTPPEIVEKLNAALREVMATDEVKARFADLGAAPEPSTPEEFEAILKADLKLYTELVAARGLKK